MTTSADNNGNVSPSYMPELPVGFYWEIRKIASDAVVAGKRKVFVFLKRNTSDVKADTITFQIVTNMGKIVEDPTEAKLAAVGESMLVKTSNRAALGLTAPLQ